MIYIKSDEEIEIIRLSNLIVGKALAEVAKIIEAGVSTIKLDKIAEEYICDNGALPGFKGYEGFPNTLCISLNEQVVHGIPSEKIILKEGDIVSIDCGTLYNGYYGDSAYTFAIGEISQDKKNLMNATFESLYAGIDKAAEGRRVGDIGYAIQKHVQSKGFAVVREMVGHGVGKDLHEEPQVPNYGRNGRGVKLRKGMVIAIEPMINFGKKDVHQAKDGWTITTKDKKPSAHFEHTVAIRKNQADILSSFTYIEEVLKNKNIFYGKTTIN
jgi:methionyl aminopeptidase